MLAGSGVGTVMGLDKACRENLSCLENALPLLNHPAAVCVQASYSTEGHQRNCNPG